MTEEQKEILIAKMLDAPSSLSDVELDSILHDDELRDIYEASAALSSACIRQPEWDMKAEWNSFRPRIRRKPATMRWVMRVAAIFLGVLFASNLVVRTIDYVFTIEQPSAIARVVQSPALNFATTSPRNPQTTEVTKEEAEQEPTIVRKHSTVANHHLAKAEINRSNPPAAQVEPTIDIDEYLRIQQARIDNDLAMQIAESYIEEYDDLIAILDAVGAYNAELDDAIKKVTME